MQNFRFEDLKSAGFVGSVDVKVEALSLEDIEALARQALRDAITQKLRDGAAGRKGLKAWFQTVVREKAFIYPAQEAIQRGQALTAQKALAYLMALAPSPEAMQAIRELEDKLGSA